MSLINRRVIYPSISQLPELFYGKGSLNVVKNINAENILVLLSNSFSKSDLYDKLKEKNLSAKNFKEEIITNAKQSTIWSICKKYSNWPPDAVLAIGGGTVLDSAKLVRHFLSFPEDTFENLFKQYVSLTPSVKLVSVPTTPNTGSESNIIAVTFDDQGKKIPFVNKSFLPNIAILDPNLLASIPKALMFDFVTDIITHAYEGTISRLSNSYIQSMAYNSVRNLESALSAYDKNGMDLEALETIQLAGHEAGIVAGNSFVGMIHALGHSLETIQGYNHGHALRLIFKQCLEWQKENVTDKNNEINFYLEKWTSLKLDQSIEYKDISSVDMKKWADLSINDPSIKTDPIKFSLEKIQDVITWIQTNY